MSEALHQQASHQKALLPNTEINLKTEADTEALAAQLAQCIPCGLVFLQGDLGAGKTTLTRYWLRALGVSGAVKSPTYTLVETYETPSGKSIFHFDLYRLTDPDELDMLGLDDCMAQIDQDGALVLVEWPSRGLGRLPKPDAMIDIAVEDDVRKLSMVFDPTHLN